jgi:hypothetical protein
MTESKKPPVPQIKRTASGLFEAQRTSLSPGPALGLPPPSQSLPSMPPLVLPKDDGAGGDAPLGAPPASISALPQGPMTAPKIVEAAPRPEEAPPRSIPPLSLRPAAPVGSWRLRLVAFAALAAALLVTAVLVGRVRRGGPTRTAFGGAGHPGVFFTTLDVRKFQRGNIHTHTTRSDGRQPPEEVAAWYRDHGYQFLAITDHDVLVEPAEIRDGEAPGFVLLPGEEISSTVGNKPVHILAVCIAHPIASGHFDSGLDALVQAITAVRAQNGFAVVNHPNYDWALGLSDLTPLTGPYALEIWSGHPFSHSEGDATRPSHQALWDELLTRDRRVTAVAVDDAHSMVPTGEGTEMLPGRAWIETFGELGRTPVCDALRGGRLYASSGVSFHRIRIEPGRLTVWVDDSRVGVDFMGSAAQVLANVGGDALVSDADGFAASYALRGGEVFVRAVARAPDGTAAWTQPYYARP